MNQLSEKEIYQVSGGKPISFFSSYLLGQKGYGSVASISASTALSLLCLAPGINMVSAKTFLDLAVVSFIQSVGGYILSTLVDFAPQNNN